MSARILRIEDWETLARQGEFQPTKMADLWGISLRQLERYFETEFQKTPTEWVREFRCRLALKLVSEGYTNKAVVVELKFGSPSHLCHEFKRVYGKSPRTFGPRLLGRECRL
jgi:AraC-like DNA-binding protein